ncbi:hypothetical protein BX600DRAFT_529023 [Xylariales sp. PMI_506]|nr:hypothetical protein BX600DRAFT_529023 [Xylariales sp. PMI_506]
MSKRATMPLLNPVHLLSTLLSLSAFSQGLLLEPATIQDNLLSSYDYIVVGAGPGGLVVANRLTEDEDVTVLVLEAGPMDLREPGITFPSGIGSMVGSRYDWNLTTVAQTSLDGNTRSISQGHAVGGGTILNGMIWTRGTQSDYDDWADLGNDGWGWDDMLPYFQRVEAFTDNLQSANNLDVMISPDSSIYGTSGFVNIAYPDYFYETFNHFVEGNMELGLDLVNDTSGGTNVGVTIPPSSISPTNQSRSDARAAYLDNVIDRTNLHIAPEQTVTRLILTQDDNDSVVAEGVQFVGTTTNVALNITATQEVILAAGAIWSPALLQVSGIGPSDVLEGLGVTTLIDLPGVGNNLQDHGMIGPYYDYTNPDLFTINDLTGSNLNDAYTDYYANRTGPLTATLIEALAYLPLSSLTSSWQETLSNLSSSDSDTYLPSDYPDTVRTGYAAQYSAIVQSLGDSSEGALEIMANSVGTLQVASQRPLSRGSVRASSADLTPAAAGGVSGIIAVDPRYGSHPFDRALLVLGLDWNARLVNGTEAMRQLDPSPPDAALLSGDAERLEAVVAAQLATEFHPCGTTAMLPLESGGVVGTDLLVHGTSNLRVVNAGVIPLIPSAHLQAVVYTIAEKAADIIRGGNITANTTTTTTTSTGGSSGTSASSTPSPIVAPGSGNAGGNDIADMLSRVFNSLTNGLI